MPSNRELRYFIFTIGVFTSFLFASYAQNLVPNPGFEEHIGDSVLIWKQPLMDYYHYEKASSQAGKPHEGEFFNGVCMYNSNVNEYLHVKLDQKLVKGQKYCIRMYARLSTIKNEYPEHINEIGWYFSQNEINVSDMTKMEVTPQITFPLEKNKNRYDWMFFDGTYVANGTEQYLTIGYFMPPDMIKEMKEKDNMKKEELELLKAERIAALDIPQKNKAERISKIRKELKSPEYASVSNDTRLKDFKDQIKSIQEEYNLEVKRTDARFQQLFDEVNARYKYNFKFFQVRCYFDDICISPITADKTCDCSGTVFDKKFAVGSVIRIENIYFETGKSKLLEVSFEELDKLVNLLNIHSNMEIQVSGHTDNQGNMALNRRLSEARAKSVIDYLSSKGIAPERLSYRGFGREKPIASNRTEEGRALNRRVEFEIRKR